MAEFLIVFVVTFLVLIGVAAAMLLGRAPVYQPDISDVEATLTRLLEGDLPETEWDFFINMPIRLNPELDAIRRVCQQAHEQYALSARNAHARLKEEGLIRIRHQLLKLEQGGSKTF